jgi:hypothetical protein
MSIYDLVTELMAILRQSPPPLRHSVVHVVINNAAPQRRPSSAIIEFEGQPSFSLLITQLPAPFALRGLIINQHLWRIGDRSTTKRQLCHSIDTFLAEELNITPTRSLHRPFIYLGPAQHGPPLLR